MAGPVPAFFVSQSKIFIDLPGPRGVAKQLLTVTKMDVKEDGSVDTVPTIGVSGGAGWREKQGGLKISLTCARTQGTVPEVDWVFHKKNKTIGTISTEDEGNGQAYSYLFRVSKVDPGFDDAGNMTDEVELAALNREED